LETAGQVFAEKGFSRTTGKEICRRSGANAAAVVYHFGGIANLYRAVLQEARQRLAPSEELAAAVARDADPRLKLTAFIRLLVAVRCEPGSCSWPMRLVIREMLSPGPIFDQIRSKEMRARAAILQAIVSELTGLPAEHAAVARCCISILAPLGILFMVGQRSTALMFPLLRLGPEAIEENTRQMVHFALGGIEAIARAASIRR
jgi:TetR/AcrR family transcriptional regulator, regulator of cefoperazone and chloramphenicol sensitivity